MEILPLELRKLGLNEKEVSVYLAGLELGASPVQAIAKSTKIARPTVYEIIRSLEKKGLFAEIQHKKKKYFSAQSPDRILGILRVQKREIEEKEREFIRIISVLETRYSKEKGEIREYKGKEGLKVLEEKFSFTSLPEIFVLSSRVNLNQIKKREEIYQKIKKRLGKIKVKEIYTEKIKSKPTPPWLQRKFLSLPYFGGTLILLDKIIFFPSQKQEGILIENETLVNLFKSFFQAMWNLI